MSSRFKPITYVADAVRPGGTPSRYLIWVELILLCQVLASVLPSPKFYEPGMHLPEYILIGTGVLIALSNLARTDKSKILVSYGLYIVGLIVTTITISTGITSLSGIVFMLTWAMTLFVSERREYISFDLVTLFMILMLVSTVILLMYNPALGVADNWIVLTTGGVITAIDIYLVYADFGRSRNFYQESRISFRNLDLFSSKISGILSGQGELEELLWGVCEECVPFLELEECVIYLYDEESGVLKQVAAYGGKSTEDNKIVAPITIQPGKGIVGKAFEQGSYVLVKETNFSSDYIVDDAVRASELAMPILSAGKPIGVIDSEHSMSGYFKERHVQAFRIMASFCGIKIMEYQARESIRQAEISKMEANRYIELDQLKNRFITNISHDLKTPLSLIKAPAMQIQSLSTDPRITKHSSYILKNTEHLMRVVGQLLQLNRVDRGLNELYLEEIEARTMINKIAGQYHGLAEKDGIVFTHESEDVLILTDTFRLEQVIHNLVHNAFRYTGKNGKVRIEAMTKNDSLVICVEDNGPGISEDLKQKVFDRFFKADENNHEGTGIGLSLVKEYTHSLGGTVEMESEMGKGTKFIVTIPFSVAESELPKATPEPTLEEDGKPVLLVVEDHADLNDFICNFFEDSYICKAAFDGEEALRVMDQFIPDLIISDLMMPEMDGTEFVKKVKSDERFEHIPVVILSAKSQVESRVDLYETGADNYITKPFDISELNAVVKNLFEQRAMLRKKLREALASAPKNQENGQVIEQSNEVLAHHEFIESVRKYVIDNLDQASMSIPELASELGMGRNKFQKQIREITGLSPVEFVRSIRLLEAHAILRQKRLSVSEVAYAVGFSNLSYFTRSFKGEFGILPSEIQNSSEVSSKS